MAPKDLNPALKDDGRGEREAQLDMEWARA